MRKTRREYALAAIRALKENRQDAIREDEPFEYACLRYFVEGIERDHPQDKTLEAKQAKALSTNFITTVTQLLKPMMNKGEKPLIDLISLLESKPENNLSSVVTYFRTMPQFKSDLTIKILLILDKIAAAFPAEDKSLELAKRLQILGLSINPTDFQRFMSKIHDCFDLLASLIENAATIESLVFPSRKFLSSVEKQFKDGTYPLPKPESKATPAMVEAVVVDPNDPQLHRELPPPPSLPTKNTVPPKPKTISPVTADPRAALFAEIKGKKPVLKKAADRELGPPAKERNTNFNDILKQVLTQRIRPSITGMFSNTESKGVPSHCDISPGSSPER